MTRGQRFRWPELARQIDRNATHVSAGERPKRTVHCAGFKKQGELMTR